MSDRAAAVGFRVLGARRRLLGPGDGDSLQNVNTTELPDGSLCWVTQSLAFFALHKGDSTTPPDGINVIKPSSGPGRWFIQTNTGSGEVQIEDMTGLVQPFRPLIQTEGLHPVDTGTAIALLDGEVDALAYPSLSAAVAANAGRTIRLINGTHTLDASISDSSVVLRFLQGAVLNVPASRSIAAVCDMMLGGIITPVGAVTATITTYACEPNRQCFDLSLGGTVVFTGATRSDDIRPEHFGVKGDNATDDTDNFQAFLNALYLAGSGSTVYHGCKGARYLIQGSLLWQLKNNDQVLFGGCRFRTTMDTDSILIDFNPAATPGNWDENVAAQVARCATTVLINNKIEISEIIYDDGSDGVATQRRALRYMNSRFGRVGGLRVDNFYEGMAFGGADSLHLHDIAMRRSRFAGFHEIDWGPQIAGTCDVVAGSTAVVGHGTDFTQLPNAPGSASPKLRFGTDPRYYTVVSVTDATHLTLTEGFGIIRGQVTSDGTTTVTNDLPAGAATADFGRQRPGDQILIGTDATVYTIDTIPYPPTAAPTMTTTVAVPAQVKVPWYRAGDQSGVAAYEMENGASKFAASCTFDNCRHLGINTSQYFIKWDGYYNNVLLINCNAAGAGSVATLWFSNASNTAGGPIALIVENFYNEQAGTNTVLYMQDVSNSPFSAVSIIGGHLGLGTSTAIRLENVYTIDIDGASLPGTALDIDTFCATVNIGAGTYIPAANAVTFRCNRGRITAEPAVRPYFGVDAVSARTFAVAGYDNTAHSTGTATIQMTDLLPSHFQPTNGGLMPKGYHVYMAIADSAPGVTTRATLAPNATLVAGAFNRCQTVRLQGVQATQARGQYFFVPAERDGSIYFDCLASGVNTLTVSISVQGYEM
jgi:hypothetical protein